MLRKARLGIAQVLYSVSALVVTAGAFIDPRSPEEQMQQMVEEAGMEMVEEDLADLFGEFDENMVVDSPLVDEEDDFVGGGPGSWKEKNPSAEEFFDTEDAEEDWEYDSVDEFVDDVEEDLYG